MIGDDIELTVLSVQGEKVRVGIQAPSDVPVFRSEIYAEIKQGHQTRGTPTEVAHGSRKAPRERDSSGE